MFLEEPPRHWELPTSVLPIEQDILFTTEIIHKELRIEIDEAKSPGLDNIHLRILNKARDVIARPLSIIFAASFQEGVAPDDWKIANVIAIHKKGEKKSPSNYRPVSLTSVCCKIMEKILRRHIMKHMIDENILSQ